MLRLFRLATMPTLRSSTRSASIATTAGGDVLVTAASSTKVSTKRKATDVSEPESAAASPSKSKGKKKARVTKAASSASNTQDTTAPVATPSARTIPDAGPPPVLVPAKLTFSFEDAKKHLINVDPRFQVLFDKLHCKPYEQLEQVHPFRALSTSILGQQISWLAARSIIHKFIRLFDPSLPEKVSDYDSSSKSPQSSFPTPHQVASTDIATLRTAGLSTRKAEYVQDLAQRFADGRLSTEKLLEANDEELAEMLIAVRGIGRWTVDMFAIFSLRRPDILPVGDLGVQRGLLRWALAAHSPTYPLSISPNKLSSIGKNDDVDSDEEEDSTLPVIHEESQPSQASSEPVVPADISSVPPAAPTATPRKLADTKGATEVNIPSLPPTFTPSIKQSLTRVSHGESFIPPPLPSGLTAAALKSRLDGKKKIKGAILTPQEMNDLTESWKPYRSLGVYYMWSLAESEVA